MGIPVEQPHDHPTCHVIGNALNRLTEVHAFPGPVICRPHAPMPWNIKPSDCSLCAEDIIQALRFQAGRGRFMERIIDETIAILREEKS